MKQDTHKDEGKGSRWRWFNPFAAGINPANRVFRAVLLVVLLYILSAPFVMWYEYQRAFPEFFDPRPAKDVSGDAVAGKTKPPAGVVFTDTLITMSNAMLESWLPNDVIYPSILLDNPQNFQLGQLEVIRYCTRVLRDKLSRQRTTDKIDPAADRAFTDFSNNPELWIFPSAESKFRDGVQALEKYRQGLIDGTSDFYPRADNLIELLDQLTSLLGGENTRLANAPPGWYLRLSEETAGDRYTEGEKLQRVKVPWTKIDDNFYRARGVAYALREVMMAVHWEFADILRLKRSTELLDNVIDELALANFEPLVVLNGSRDSIFANHSLKLMATLEDVRQKLINLQHMLER